MRLTDWIRGAHGRSAPSEPLETRDDSSGYTDALLSLLTAQASGSASKADVNIGGALELAAGVVGRAFASAQVDADSQSVRDTLTPSVLAHIGRALIRAGEAVFAIQVADGALVLLPASSWDIQGGVLPASWEYRLSIGAPNGTAETTLPYDGVVHVRYAYAPERAWVGLSPLEIARQAGRLDAEINEALADESGMPRGAILPMAVQPEDDDDDDDGLTDFERELGKLRGKIITTESQRTLAAGGYQEAPKDDFELKRVGAMFGQPLVNLRRDADELVLGLCGVPIEFLKGADGSALREAYRRMLFGTIQPLGAIVAEELSAKLETPISFSWNELRAADRAAGARAYKALVEAKMSEDRALELSGL